MNLRLVASTVVFQYLVRLDVTSRSSTRLSRLESSKGYRPLALQGHKILCLPRDSRGKRMARTPAIPSNAAQT
jgi:hypothetical protein